MLGPPPPPRTLPPYARPVWRLPAGPAARSDTLTPLGMPLLRTGLGGVPLWNASAERSARATLIGFRRIVNSGPMKTVIRKTAVRMVVGPDLRIL